MQKIHKKIWSKYFEAILRGDKTFEIRLIDFEIKEENILVLEEWGPKKKQYTGRGIEKKVSYVAKTKNIKAFGARKR